MFACIIQVLLLTGILVGVVARVGLFGRPEQRPRSIINVAIATAGAAVGVFLVHALHLYRGSHGDLAVLAMAVGGACVAELIHAAVARKSVLHHRQNGGSKGGHIFHGRRVFNY